MCERRKTDYRKCVLSENISRLGLELIISDGQRGLERRRDHVELSFDEGSRLVINACAGGDDSVLQERWLPCQSQARRPVFVVGPDHLRTYLPKCRVLQQ